MYTEFAINPSKPVHLYSLRLADVRSVERLDRWLPAADVEDDGQFDEDADEWVVTSTKVQVMYLALMSVILDQRPHQKDRFIQNKTFLPLSTLMNITASGEEEPQHPLDSLGCLIQLTYRKITSLFRSRISRLETNFQRFWFFRSVFLAAQSLLQQYARDEYTGQLHTQSLLTMILKQKNPHTLVTEFKKWAVE